MKLKFYIKFFILFFKIILINNTTFQVQKESKFKFQNKKFKYMKKKLIKSNFFIYLKIFKDKLETRREKLIFKSNILC